jgi:hypothetical protein
VAVDPYKGEIYTLQFARAGMVAHQNRWLSTAAELAIAENCSFEEDLLRKDVAAANYDSADNIKTETPSGTISSSQNWAEAAIWLPASLTTAIVGIPLKKVATTTSPWTITITSTAAAGQCCVLAVSQLTFSTDTPTCTTVTDSKGNPWVRQVTVPGAFVSVEMWVSILATTLTGGVDTITLTFTHAGSAARAMNINAFSGVLTATSDVTASGGSGPSTSFQLTPAAYEGFTYPALAVAALGMSGVDAVTVTWTGPWNVSPSVSADPAIAVQANLSSRVIPFAHSIMAQYDWKADEPTAPAGFATTAAGSTTVTGSGTAFLTAFVAGDEIVVGGETQVVATITSNTILDTLGRWTTVNAAVAMQRRSGPRVVTASLVGVLYKDAPTSGGGGNTGVLDAVKLKSGLTVSRRRGRFVAAGKEVAANLRKLFYFNGVDVVQVLSGDAATTHDLGTPPADWAATADAGKQPVNGIVHQGRLIGFGNLNDPHRIYLSTPDNHEVFTGVNAFQFSVSSNIGERLWCAAEFQGVLFFWKYPLGIFYMDDTDTNFLNWSYHTRTDALGCAPSPHAVLPIDDDVLFCSADGHFHLLSAVSNLGGQASSDLTLRLGLHRWTQDNVNTAALDQIVSAWNATTKVAYIGLRSKAAPNTAPDNDLLLKWDFGLVDRGGPVRFSYSTAWHPNALSVKRRDFTGTPSILIGELTTSMFAIPTQYGFRTNLLSQGPQGFAHRARTPQLDFSDQDPSNRLRRKHYDALELVLKDASVLVGNPLTVRVYIDQVLKQTSTFASATRRPMLPLRVGDGYECEVELQSATASVTDIAQVGALVYWRPGGQDKSRVS